jgi:hypothetical protein
MPPCYNSAASFKQTITQRSRMIQMKIKFLRIFRNNYVSKQLAIINERLNNMLHLSINILNRLSQSGQPIVFFPDSAAAKKFFRATIQAKFEVRCMWCDDLKLHSDVWIKKAADPEAIVSHGMCKPCARKHYQEFFHAINKCDRPPECCTVNCNCQFVDGAGQSVPLQGGN